MITLQFEEALINQIASMTELEKESLFEKLHEHLVKNRHDHVVTSVTARELEEEIEEIKTGYSDMEREKEEAEEKYESVKNDLRDALKLPLAELHNKLQEIINDL